MVPSLQIEMLRLVVSQQWDQRNTLERDGTHILKNPDQDFLSKPKLPHRLIHKEDRCDPQQNLELLLQCTYFYFDKNIFVLHFGGMLRTLWKPDPIPVAIHPCPAVVGDYTCSHNPRSHPRPSPNWVNLQGRCLSADVWKSFPNSSFIGNNPKLETTQTFFTKQTVAHPYRGMTPSNKKEQTSDTRNS